MANCPAGVSCWVIYQLMICGFICLKLKPAEILKFKKISEIYETCVVVFCWY